MSITRFCCLVMLLLCSKMLHAQSEERRSFDGAIDGRHSLSLTPICGMVTYGKLNPGLGFEYEYIFNQEAGIGLRLPIAFGYTGPEQDFNSYYGGYYKHTTFYAAPGIRFHAPVGGGKNAEFATGPAILLGNMHFRPSNDDYGSPTITAEPFNYGLLGIMADNSINFYRGHFQFGFDVRVGALAEVRDDSRFFIHFGMHFGGKF